MNDLPYKQLRSSHDRRGTRWKDRSVQFSLRYVSIRDSNKFDSPVTRRKNRFRTVGMTVNRSKQSVDRPVHASRNHQNGSRWQTIRRSIQKSTPRFENYIRYLPKPSYLHRSSKKPQKNSKHQLNHSKSSKIAGQVELTTVIDCFTVPRNSDGNISFTDIPPKPLFITFIWSLKVLPLKHGYNKSLLGSSLKCLRVSVRRGHQSIEVGSNISSEVSGTSSANSSTSGTSSNQMNWRFQLSHIKILVDMIKSNHLESKISFIDENLQVSRT